MTLLDRFDLDNKKVILIMIVFLTAAYLDYAMIIRSQVDVLNKVGPKIQASKIEIDNINRQLAVIKAAMGKKKAGPQLRPKVIISETEVSNLLEDISNIANKNNIKISEIKPSRASAKLTKPVPGQAVPNSSVLVPLEVSGAYHNIGKFINELENQPKLIVIDDFKIYSTTGDYFTQKANLTLKIYVKK